MNKRFTCYFLCLLACYLVVTSYSSGPGSNGLNQTGSKGTIAGCSAGSCHNVSANTTVTIEVDSALTFPVTHYIPGNTYIIKIHGLNSANLPAFGFQFSSVKGTGSAQLQAGSFSGFPANTHVSTVNGISLLEHSNAITASGGVYNVSFTWTAPVAGSGNVSLYCALNAVNLNNANTGDQFATTTATLTEINCPLPVIATQPTTQAVCAGSPVTFTVGTTAAGATYQWRLNGNPIAGATNATYTIPSASAANAGSYTVTVSNTCGGTLSNAATLTVNTAPVITTQPLAHGACVGSSTSFVVATSSSGATYQWRLNGNPITGATSATYTIPSVATANAGNYTAVLTNTCGNTTSSSVALTVNALPTPTITQTGLTLSTGTFSTYQWVKDAVNIPGATASTYNVTANGVYTVKVTDANSCSNTSTGVTITNVSVESVDPDGSVIRLFPNPASSVIYMKAPSPLNISIKDLTGRTVLLQNQSLSADIRHLAKGVYTITLSDKDNRLLKQELLIVR